MTANHKRADSLLVEVIPLTFFIALSVNLYEDVMELDFDLPCKSIWGFSQECWFSSEDDTFGGLGFTPCSVIPEPTPSFADKTSNYIPETTYLSQRDLILRC